MDTPTKRCRDCGQYFPYDMLKKSKNCNDGVRALCKDCANKREQRRYHADLDSARQYNREKCKRLRHANPEGTREKVRNWRRANPDKYRESKRKSDSDYYRRNRDHLKTKASAYSRAHPPYWRARNAKRRARKRQAEGSYTSTDVQAQYDKQRGLCYWCSEPLLTVHADHIVPLSRGGSNWPSNIVCTCQRCNLEKHASLPYIEWQPRNPLEPPQLPV